jgi:photosystem II stability/assembly factor-like uncharacterized protein
MSPFALHAAAYGARLRASGVLAAAFAIVLSFLVAACGGGSGGSAPPQPRMTILGQPVDATVNEGTTPTFSVVTSAPATYRWQRESAGAWADVPQATSASYTLPAVRASDDGSRFRVIATSQAETSLALTSSIATLHVVAQEIAPAIVVPPVDASVVEGQVASFSVTASGTALTYRWLQTGDGSNFYVMPGANAATLSLPPATLSMNGMGYLAEVVNDVGDVKSAVVHLTVTAAPAAPVFTTVPAPVVAVEGQAATFQVVVVGAPAPTLRWEWSRDLANWTPVANQSLASLTLPAVALADDGKVFRAVATNASGAVASPAALLTVTPKPVAPTITRQPADARVGVGATPTFVAVATGTPDPTWQWQVSTDGGTSWANVVGATSASYTVPPTVEGDDGKRLRAIAQNASGTATTGAALLTVIPVPHISRQPETQAWHVGQGSPTFEVVAAGSGLTYQWQSRAGNGAFADLPGETGARYVHTGTASDPTTQVRVVITNTRGGVATSDAADLVALRWTAQVPSVTLDAMNALRWLDAQTVVAVGDAGTVLRSTDGGLGWAAVEENAPPQAIRLNGLAFDGGQVGVAVGDQGIIRRTADGGLHWLTMRAADANLPALRAAVFVDATTVVAVGDQAMVLRSTDGGQTWAAVDLGSGNVGNVRDVAVRAGVAVAVTDGAMVLRSINGGAQWNVAQVATTLYSVAFADDDTLVAAGFTSPLRSTDAGLTWQLASIDVFQPFLTAVDFADAQHGAASGVPWGGASLTFYVTSDGGATWTTNPNWHSAYVDPATVRFGPSGTALASAGPQVLRRSTDAGLHWTSVSGAPLDDDHLVSDLAFCTPSDGLMAGDDVILRTTDGGASWQPVAFPVSPPADQWFRIAYADADHVFVMETWGEFMESFDAGATWTDRGSFFGARGQQVGDMAFAPNGQLGLVSATNGSVLRTTDGGLSWSEAYRDPKYCVSDVAFGSDANVAIAGCDGTVMSSQDGGVTWTRGTTQLSAYGVDLTFVDANTVVAAGRGAIARSTDGGRTFSFVFQDFTYPSPLGLGGAVFLTATHGFVPADDGTVRETTDGGLTWSVQSGSRVPGSWGLTKRDAHTLVFKDGAGGLSESFY